MLRLIRQQFCDESAVPYNDTSGECTNKDENLPQTSAPPLQLFFCECRVNQDPTVPVAADLVCLTVLLVVSPKLYNKFTKPITTARS